eukprot:1898567-Rhodomonas_salina.2
MHGHVLAAKGQRDAERGGGGEAVRRPLERTSLRDQIQSSSALHRRDSVLGLVLEPRARRVHGVQLRHAMQCPHVEILHAAVRTARIAARERARLPPAGLEGLQRLLAGGVQHGPRALCGVRRHGRVQLLGPQLLHQLDHEVEIRTGGHGRGAAQEQDRHRIGAVLQLLFHHLRLSPELPGQNRSSEPREVKRNVCICKQVLLRPFETQRAVLLDVKVGGGQDR